MLIYCVKIQYSTAPATRTDEDDSCPVQAIQLHLPQSSLRGRDIAGTCRSFLLVMFISIYINVSNM